MSGSSTCRSCGRPIVWAKTTNGKNMPLDPDPAPDGNLYRETAGTESGRVLFNVFPYNETRHAGKPRYRSHFVSCPNAAQHRRRK